MTRFPALVLAALLFAVTIAAAASDAAAAIGDEYVGDWESNDLELIQEWDSGKCGAIFFTTRKYLIGRRSGTGALMITYTNQTQARYYKNAEKTCLVLGQSSPTTLYNRVRMWQGDANIDAQGRLAIDAIYVGCQMMGCHDEPLMFTGPFRASLSIDSGSLIDHGDNQTVTWETRFYRNTDLPAARAEASAGLTDILAALPVMEPEEFAEKYLMRRARDSGGAPEQVRVISRIVRHLTSRETFEIRLINQVKEGEGFVPARYALFLNEAKVSTGASALEVVVLVFEDGMWKIMNYQVH